MPFSDRVKLEAKKKAAYMCCICRKSDMSLEVHHILPENEGGNSDIDNAVLLCSSCHSNFGANPDKRKLMKEMRNYWYETVERIYSPPAKYLLETAFRIQQEQISNLSSEVNTLKTRLRTYVDQSIDEMEITPGTAMATVSAFLNASTSYQSPSNYCVKCGYQLPKTDLYCPNCGEPCVKIILK